MTMVVHLLLVEDRDSDAILLEETLAESTAASFQLVRARCLAEAFRAL